VRRVWISNDGRHQQLTTTADQRTIRHRNWFSFIATVSPLRRCSDEDIRWRTQRTTNCMFTDNGNTYYVERTNTNVSRMHFETVNYHWQPKFIISAVSRHCLVTSDIIDNKDTMMKCAKKFGNMYGISMFLKTVFWRSYTWSGSFADIKVQYNIDITGVIKFYNDKCSQIY